MNHFFVSKEQINDKCVYIEGGDYNHLRNVLRVEPGEEVSVSNGEDGKEYRCILESYDDDRALLKVIFVKESNVESPAKIVLYQGLPKADKMELIIQKCVELGVAKIVPVSTRRAVVKLDDKKAAGKITRWQAIAEAAGKQSQRAIVPIIGQVMTFKEAVKEASESDVKMIPYEMCEDMNSAKEVFDGLKPGQTISIFIGPEGGFDESEVELAKSMGIIPVSLGKRILRTETAGMMVISWIDYCLEVK